MRIGDVDSLIDLIPTGWTLACLNQSDDKSWFCEMREGFLTSYNRVVLTPTRYSPVDTRPKSPSEAIQCCLDQIDALVYTDAMASN